MWLKFHEILHQNHNNLWLQISWDINNRTTISQGCRIYEILRQILVAEFARYYTRTSIFHGCWLLNQITISHGCRFRDILNQNLNSIWLQISWDITQEPQYLMVADFMRYYTRTTISHGCRFCEILHQNHNISWLQILWDIRPGPQYIMKSATKTYCGAGVISQKICNQVMLWFWCNISQNLKIWDIVILLKYPI